MDMAIARTAFATAGSSIQGNKLAKSDEFPRREGAKKIPAQGGQPCKRVPVRGLSLSGLSLGSSSGSPAFTGQVCPVADHARPWVATTVIQMTWHSSSSRRLTGVCSALAEGSDATSAAIEVLKGEGGEGSAEEEERESPVPKADSIKGEKVGEGGDGRRWSGRRGRQRLRVNRDSQLVETSEEKEIGDGRPKLSWLTDGTMDLSTERTVWRVNRAISRCTSVREALAVVEEMKSAGLNAANEGTYVALITVCRRQRQGDRALIVYEAMKQAGIRPGMLTFNTLISCCQQAQRLEDAFRLKADMESLGLTPDVVTYTSLMALVVKTSPYRGRTSPAQRFAKAMELFKEMQEKAVQPDAITFNTLMYAGAQAKLPGKVLEVYGMMVASGVAPNQFSFGILLEAVGHGGRLKAALKVFGEMKACGIPPATSTYNFLIEACGTAPQPDSKRAWALYEEMVNSGRTDVNMSAETLNYLITACCKAADHVGAMRAYEIMKEKKFLKAINVSLFNKLIHSASAVEYSERAFELYSLMRAEGHRPDAITFGTLISTCAKNADVARALTVWQEMEELKVVPNQAAYHALIGVYAKAGQWEESIRVFREMCKNRPEEPPSAGSYALVLDACFGPEGAALAIKSLVDKRQRLLLTPGIRAAVEIFEEAVSANVFLNLSNSGDMRRCDLRNLTNTAAVACVVWYMQKLKSCSDPATGSGADLIFVTGSDKGRAVRGQRNGRFPQNFVNCENTLKAMGLRPQSLRTLSMHALTVDALQLDTWRHGGKKGVDALLASSGSTQVADNGAFAQGPLLSPA